MLYYAAVYGGDESGHLGVPGDTTVTPREGEGVGEGGGESFIETE